MRRTGPYPKIIAFAVAAIEIALIVAMLFLTTCSLDLLTDERVTLVLPTAPAAFRLAAPGKKISWTLSWYDESGKIRTERNIAQDCTISLARGIFTAVLLAPETDGTGIPEGAIPCAGAVYPAQCGEGKLVLSWTGGVSASMAQAMCLHARGGYDAGRTIAHHVNWNRFEEEAAKLPAPHRIDRKRFVEAALSGSISKWDIKLPVTADVTFPSSLANAAGKSAIALPAEGETFVPEWPGAESFSWSQAKAVTVSVTEGTNRFFSGKGYITVVAKSGKIESSFFSLYSLQD